MTECELDYKYVPKLVREKGWKGHVVVELYDLDKHYALAEKSAGLGQANKDDDSGIPILKLTRELVDASKGHYRQVDLTAPDGRTAKSFDDLWRGGAHCHSLLTEVAMGLLNGFDEGNSDAPSDKE